MAILAAFSLGGMALMPMRASAGTLEDMIQSGALPAAPQKVRSKIMVNNILQNSRVTIVILSERDPKTRTPIHAHNDSGVTCLLEGEMTLFIEGEKPIRKMAGECYYMPSGTRMIGYNSGNTVAKFLDFFNYRQNGESLTIVEAKGCDEKSAAFKDICKDNPYIKQHQHP
jgi:quercetin dioxygenase-like cupin family protein